MHDRERISLHRFVQLLLWGYHKLMNKIRNENFPIICYDNFVILCCDVSLWFKTMLSILAKTDTRQLNRPLLIILSVKIWVLYIKYVSEIILTGSYESLSCLQFYKMPRTRRTRTTTTTRRTFSHVGPRPKVSRSKKGANCSL